MNDDPLDSYLQDLFASEPPGSSDEAERRIAKRLAAGMGAGAQVSGLASEVLQEMAGDVALNAGSAAASSAVGMISTKIALLMTMGALGVGALGGAAAHHAWTSTVGTEDTIQEQRPNVPEPAVDVPEAPELPEPAPEPVPERTPEAQGELGEPSSPVERSEEELQHRSRRRERALLRQAQNALARVRPQDALDALARHRRRFPQTAFAEERDAMEVQALRANGDEEEAAVHARRFLSHYPHSIFSPRVRQALD